MSDAFCLFCSKFINDNDPTEDCILCSGGCNQYCHIKHLNYPQSFYDSEEKYICMYCNQPCLLNIFCSFPPSLIANFLKQSKSYSFKSVSEYVLLIFNPLFNNFGILLKIFEFIMRIWVL